MRSRSVVVGCVLAAVGVSACGSTRKPLAGTPGVRTLAGGLAPGRGVVDDPRTRSLRCLRTLSLGVVESGPYTLFVGQGGDQARVVFLPTPGAAQYAQISGSEQGAEAIGSALLYPQAMSEDHLSQVESCLSKGV